SCPAPLTARLHRHPHTCTGGLTPWVRRGLSGEVELSAFCTKSLERTRRTCVFPVTCGRERIAKSPSGALSRARECAHLFTAWHDKQTSGGSARCGRQVGAVQRSRAPCHVA